MPVLTAQSSPTVAEEKKITARVSEKKSARDFQSRRHEDWNDNYQLYRNKVKINRLTQRQAVNIPLMKETIKTLISKIDEAPTIDWQDLGGDEAKEMVFQEMWNADFTRLNMEAIDVQDKKTVLLYGRAFKKLDWGKDGVEVKALDIFDIVVDPLTDPLDLETARFVIHQNIFRSLKDVLADDRYTAKGRGKLKTFLTSDEGVVQSGLNRKQYEEKTRRLRQSDDGETTFNFDSDIAAGEVIVNITEHISNVWSARRKKFVKHVIVYADDMIELMDIPLKKLLGIDFYPYVSWGDDVETNDFWSDGPADLVRTPNKVVNVWFSQLIENRTLSNFQMHWYDATAENYEPQTYEPGAGRMLPAPGSPKDTIMPVEINGLDETMTSIDFIIRLIERGTAATSIEKGVSEKKQITLGEVETLVGKAMERTLSMAKFYKRSWEELAIKWYSLTDANDKGVRTLYKMSANGKLWPRKVTPTNWKSKEGYRPTVRSLLEQEEENTKSIQRFMFVRSQFPNNPALNRISQKRALELLKLTPEELRQITADQEQVDETVQLQQQVAAEQGQEGGEQAQGLQQSLNELNILQNT